MSKASLPRLLAILVLAGVFALLLRWLFVTTTRPPRIVKAEIEVAATALPAGRLITAGDLAWREIAADAVVKGEIVKGDAHAKQMLGAVVRHAVAAGAPMAEKDVVFPDDPGFLAAALAPGMRAVSVAIDDVTGNAGLILPGDHVDLLLTQRISETTGAPPKVASETILSGVRVIAVGSQFRTGDDEGRNGGHASRARTVTLEVDPHDGEKVAVATRLGQLSLALRSLATARPDTAAPPAAADVPVWGRDVSAAVRSLADEDETAPREEPRPSAPTLPQVFHGGQHRDSGTSEAVPQ